MRALFLVAIWVLLSAAAQLPADSTASSAWFARLSSDTRQLVQGDLVLTGQYDGLVYGRFGPATFAALKSYQAKFGEPLTGVLSDAALTALNSEGDSLFAKFGMKQISEDPSGIAVYLPTAVLTKRVVGTTGAVSYSSVDDGISVSLNIYIGWKDTVATFAGELTSIHVDGRTVTYSAVGADYLVVTGVFGDHRFYTFYLKAHGDLLGYTLNWTDHYSKLGPIFANFAASYAQAASDVKQEVASQPDSPVTPIEEQSAPVEPSSGLAPYSDEGERIGPFLLPSADPQTIVLDGDIGDNSALDFLRATRSRPTATRLILNSTGGYVTPALLIAHEVNTRGLSTVVENGRGCFSACAYIFFAGKTRRDTGALGVHQIYGDGQTAETAQYSLSDVLDALKDYDTPQQVISVMLRTSPDAIHIFSAEEISGWGIDRPIGDVSPIGETPARSSSQPTPADTVKVLGTQSLLLEASDDGITGAWHFQGTVEWSKGHDEAGQPTLVGKANVPGRNLSVDVLIRRNVDPSLPTRQLMEINFAVSDNFVGGSIAGLSGVLLKDEELVQGAPLVGASARVIGNSFLFALTDTPADSVQNVDLLTSRKWIDLALIYATGKRAILTLEKDDAAMAMFRDTFATWQNATNSAAADQSALDAAAEAARQLAKQAATELGL